MRGGEGICPVFRRLDNRDWNDPAEARRNRKGPWSCRRGDRQVVLRIRHDGRSQGISPRPTEMAEFRVGELPWPSVAIGPIGMDL